MTISHIACPCGKSSDAYTLNDSGVGHCFSCNKNFPPVDKGLNVITTDTQPINIRPIQPISPAFRAFDARSLSRDTMAKYKVNLDNEGKASYPHYKADVHTANKFRGPDKQFWSEGPISSCDLFGQQLFPPSSARAITVVEGQDDAMAAYEMMGSKYPVVSVLNAATAEQDMRRAFEYLNSFDTIVINFDNDDAGKLASKKCANLPFPMGKVKVLFLNKHKDANDYKKEGQAGDYTKEWWQSPVHKPDGIKLGKEMWD